MTEVIIDEASAQTLVFESRATSKDSDGFAGTPVWTTIASVTGDVQPWDGELAEGSVTSVRAEAPTHIAFTETRPTGVKRGHYIRDEAGDRFLILFIHSWHGGHLEFDLRNVTEDLTS